MKLNHLRFYPDGAAARQQDFRGVDLSTQPNLAELAAPFGMVGLTVTDRAALRSGAEKALQSVRSGTTAILDVHVSR
jgi:acetolactate synthase-1/2/3 large subunit